jgi:hypothetical protein
VSIDVGKVKDWDEIEALVQESYRLIAPKKTYARWRQGRAGEAAREAAKKFGKGPTKPRA